MVKGLTFRQNDVFNNIRSTSAPQSAVSSSVPSQIQYDTFDGRVQGKKKMRLENPNYSFAGFKKLKDKFTNDEIANLNTKRELPNGYYLKAVHREINLPLGKKVKDGVLPSQIKLVKLSDEKAEKLKSSGKFLSNKLPEGYRLENDNKGQTYLVSDKHKDINAAKEWQKKRIIFDMLFVIGASALIIVGSNLLSKKLSK